MFKTFIQIVLITILIFILTTVFYKYFYVDNPTKEDVEESLITNNKKEIEKKQNAKDNIIYNLSYKKFDIQNNIYLIEALEGIIQENNPNIIIMRKVKASIKYLDNEKLQIYSENAIFNTKTFETNFFNGVKLNFDDQILSSDKLDFYFEKNIAIFKDNVRYKNLDTNMYGDEIKINLLTKEVLIKGKDSSNKVIVQKK
tara:strand:+ start:592 stop:1188 length:597 start_codon:yes stop_codon:yes gene_type:complete